MQHTVIALMQDRPGALNRAVSLFRRRDFNIDSLAVATTEIPGLSRRMSATEKAGRFSNRLRSIVVSVWPLGAVLSSARAMLGVMPAVSDANGAGAAAGRACGVRAEVRTAGLRAAGLAAVPRGASTVTAGNDVCANALDGKWESALPITSRLAPPKAR